MGKQRITNINKYRDRQGMLTASVVLGRMTSPVDMWHIARSVSDRALDSDVRQSANRKSAKVTSRNGVHTLPNVHVKNSLVSCQSSISICQHFRIVGRILDGWYSIWQCRFPLSKI